MFPVIYSEDFLQHDTGAGHPECPERLTAIRQALLATPWANQLEWRLPTPIADRSPLPDVRRVHSDRYIQGVERLAHVGGGYLDADTPISAQSYEIALLAVNAWIDGVDAVRQTGEPIFVLARPPGHHALGEIGMGFCLFSNAAIAAHYALTQPDIERVAILDWDVHHGNGTQALVQENAQIAYCSLHEFPQYPGTGAATEHGLYDNVLNLPMTAGNTIAEYGAAFEQHVVPFLSGFQPDLLIVSAGYDANQADPLARIALQPDDYGLLTQYGLSVTRRIVFGLEGGYDLEALGQSVVATIAACLRTTPPTHVSKETLIH